MRDELAIEIMEKLDNKYNMSNFISLDEYVCEYWDSLTDLERSKQEYEIKIKENCMIVKAKIKCQNNNSKNVTESFADCVKKISNTLSGPTVASLARCNTEDIKKAGTALERAKNPRIHILQRKHGRY